MSKPEQSSNATFHQLVKQLAETLVITEEQATSLLKQEQARAAAGAKYRQSAAYKLRLEQQKAVRAALKGVTV